jgi:hypothetical protein
MQGVMMDFYSLLLIILSMRSKKMRKCNGFSSFLPALIVLLALLLSACPSPTDSESSFVEVSVITGVPSGGVKGAALDLNAAVVAPADATNKTIVWTVKDAGETGVSNADLAGGAFTPANAGALALTATVTKGKAGSADYIQDFTITIADTFTAVSDIAGAPTGGVKDTELDLGGVVVAPANATNTNIVWTVKDPGETGVTTEDLGTGKFTSPNAGTLVVTATIAKGKTETEDYAQDFSIAITATFVPVTKITGLPVNGNTETAIDLTAAVVDPAAATNKAIVWSVKEDGGTGLSAADLAEGAFTPAAGGALVLTATVAKGKAGGQEDFTQDFTISITGKAQGNAELYFDYGRRRTDTDPPGPGTYTVPLHRALVLAPVRWGIGDGASYEWKVDGKVQAETGECFSYTPSKMGTTTVTVTAADGAGFASATTLVDCVKLEGAYIRPKIESNAAQANKVFEYTPAPGQFIKELIGLTDTEESVRIKAQAKMDSFTGYGQLAWLFSLGGFGGYAVFGFDHSVMNVAGKPSLMIAGNAFGGWHEPGVIWVSQDDNGNGIPDDTWYELQGSEHANPYTIRRYAVKYHRPTGSKGPSWVDNRGNTGSFPMEDYYGDPQGYPWSAQGEYVILTGTLLPSGLSSGGLVDSHAFDWGYVDNTAEGVNFRISDAVQADGTPANLQYIDFVKVHTGLNEYAGIFGEVSTEVCIPSDNN